MGLRKWNVFLAVVDSGSYTKAGEELGYTQAGITQMMKSLEKEVGFPLFHKGHQGVSLTGEGVSLLPSIRHLISAEESLNQEISFLTGSRKGTLKIGTYTSCSIHWIPGIIQTFRREYPGIHFDISEGNEAELSNWIRDHKVDIAFTSYQSCSSYHFIHLYDDPMLAVVPKGHPLAAYNEVPIELFESSDFVVSDYTYLNDVHRILKTAGVTPDIKYTSHNDYSILSMVEHNLGISILPELILKGSTGNFEARPLKPCALRRLGMAVSSPADISPAMKIFIEYTKNYINSLKTMEH
jgi:DNA-binding transcriptional LysR family regulator